MCKVDKDGAMYTLCPTCETVAYVCYGGHKECLGCYMDRLYVLLGRTKSLVKCNCYMNEDDDPDFECLRCDIEEVMGDGYSGENN